MGVAARPPRSLPSLGLLLAVSVALVSGCAEIAEISGGLRQSGTTTSATKSGTDAGTPKPADESVPTTTAKPAASASKPPEVASPPPAAPPIDLLKQRIAQDRFDWRGYHELGLAYYRLGHYDAAIASYHHALSLTPIGRMIEAERQQQDAIAAQRQAEATGRQQQQQQQAMSALFGIIGGLAPSAGINPGLLQAAGAATSFAMQAGALATTPGGPDIIPESQVKAKREIAEVQDNLGEAYLAREDYDQAVKAFEDALGLDPSRMKTLQSLGFAHFRAGQYDKAVPALNRVLVLNPTPPHPSLYLWLSTAYMRQGLLKEQADTFATAAARFRSLVAQNANDPATLNPLADAYFDTNHHREAAEIYEQSLAARRTQSRVLRRLGISYYVQGRPNDAARILREAVTAERGDAIAWLWLGRAQERLGAEADAKTAFNQVAATYSDGRPPTVSVAAAYAALGQSARALPWLEELAARNPSSSYRAFELGLAYEKAGHYEDALEAMERALWLDSTDVLARDSIQRLAGTLAAQAGAALQKADQAMARGRPAEALPDLATALARLPEGRAKQDTLLKLLRIVATLPSAPPLTEAAQRHFGRGNAALKSATGPEGLDRAIAEYSAAVRRSPWGPSLYLNTALAYGQRRRYPDAILHLKLYLIASPNAKDASAVLDRIYELEYLQEQEQRGPALLSRVPVR